MKEGVWIIVVFAVCCCQAQDPYLLIVEQTSIKSVSLDGATVSPVIQQLTDPGHIAVSSVSGYIFYTDLTNREIYRANLDGSSVVPIVTGLTSPYGLLVHETPPRVYWSDTGAGVVERADFDGGNREILAKNRDQPTSIIIDELTGLLYFNDGNVTTTVKLDGTSITPVQETEAWFTAAVMDSGARKVYFHEPSTAAILALNLADGGTGVIVTPGTIAQCEGLALVNYMNKDYLYYTDSVQTLVRISLNGGGGNSTNATSPETIREGLNQPGRMALVDPSLYVDPAAPVLTAPTTPEGALKFICAIAVRDDGQNEFRVQFKSVHKIVETMVVTGQEAVLTLDNDEAFKRGAGNTMECLVQTRKMVNGQEQLGAVSSSNILEASVTLHTDELTLVEGGEAKEILLTCNAPPAFFGELTFSLHIELVKENIELRTSDGKVIDQAVVEAQPDSDTSEITVTGDNWWKPSALKFRVKARLDGKVEYGQTVRQMKVYQVLPNSVPIAIGTTKLQITDGDRYASCYAQNDPHMGSIDRNWYELQWLGEFVFYRNGNYQINLVFQRCYSYRLTPTCTCGIYIRVGSDVWVFDKCLRAGGSPYANPLMMYVITPPGQPVTSNVQVRAEGAYYGRRLVVTLPHGGQLSIPFSMGFLNAIYSPSPADWKAMEGLCGTYDGDSNNDQTLRDGTVLTRSWNPTQFIQDWRATDADSLTWGVWEVEPTSVHNIVYCSVIEGALEVCTEGLDIVQQGSVADDNDIADEIAKQKFASRPNNRNKFAAGVENARKKRAAETTYDPLDPFAPIVADVDHVPVAPTWPTPYGRTEAEVTTFCDSSINNHPGVQICQTMLDDDFSDVVQDCIRDIKATDNIDWANDAIEGILKRCTIHADKVDNSAADGDPPPPLPNGVDKDALFAAVCPNDCSGNGTCTDGACACTGDYVGADCSMHLSDPPEVTVLFETFCDLSSRSCAEAIVFGDKFHNRPTLTCHIHEYTLGSPLPTGPATEVLAQFTKFDQIACPMPEGHRPHILQVSNDGTNMAAARRLFAPHHLDCFTCSMAGDDITTAICVKKPRTCLIDGNCYMHGEENPDDSCQVCKSDKSYSSWTAACILGVGMILAYTAAAVFAVILIVVMILIVYFCIRETPDPEVKGFVRRMSSDNQVHPYA